MALEEASKANIREEEAQTDYRMGSWVRRTKTPWLCLEVHMRTSSSCRDADVKL